MKRILSCSLFQAPAGVYWRNDRTEDRMSAYMRFVPILVRAFHAIWPGWQLRIHHDDAVRSHPYFPALARMHDAGLVHMVACGQVPALTLAMLWRLRPVFETGEFDRLVVSHDLDSLPLLRLRCMLMDFEKSDHAVMLVHACESHDGVMGGGIAVKSKEFVQLVRSPTWDVFTHLSGYIDWNQYSMDEDYQRRTVWPMVKHRGMIFRDQPKSTTIPCDTIVPHPQSVPEDIAPEILAYGDAFAPYIGSAGYEIDRAFSFYDAPFGTDPKILSARADDDKRVERLLIALGGIRGCEDGINVHATVHP